MNKGIFITGTGTDVGKTYITALIIKAVLEQGINVGYFKAVLSGAGFNDGDLIPGDAEYVCNTAGVNAEPNKFVPYLFKTAASPHLAAKIENNPVEIEAIQKRFKEINTVYDYIVAEGSGGIICPLRLDYKTIMLTDIIKIINFDIIIVADSGLGTINSTILTVEYARAQDIRISGIILNKFEHGNLIHEDNKKTIEMLTELPIIACVSKNATEIHLNMFI